MINTEMAVTVGSRTITPVKYLGGQQFENEIFSVRYYHATNIPSGTVVPVVMGFEWISGMDGVWFDIIIYNGRYYQIIADSLRML